MPPVLCRALSALALLSLAACGDVRLVDPADHTQIARVVDHDRGTTLPGASSSLRNGAVLPGDSQTRGTGL